MNIAAAQETDLPAIQQILHDARLPAQDLTREHLPRFLIARDGAAIAAVIGLEPYGRHGLLRSLAVQPAYRARGLGSHMVAQLEEQALREGIVSLYLLTTTAERFFTHLGYSRQERDSVPAEIQASSEFSELCPDSAVVMFRLLG